MIEYRPCKGRLKITPNFSGNVRKRGDGSLFANVVGKVFTGKKNT